MHFIARVLHLLAGALLAAGAVGAPPPAASRVPAARAMVAPAPAPRVVHLTLRQLGAAGPLELRGVVGGRDVTIGSRADEVVVGAHLKLRLSYSPAMLAELSHLKVSLNGEPAAAIPLPKETAGREIVREIDLNPQYFTDFNHLRLELIGHYTLNCEDPNHSSLWATVSELSEVEISYLPLELRNDLALLPAPFFDRRDPRRLELPMVLPAHPSRELARSAGVVASWFGVLADYRSARFPVYLGQLPAAHAVVFATNQSKPTGLALADVAGPTISIVDHPTDRHLKLLVFMGRDEAELRQATLGLVLGQAVLTGQSAQVSAASVTARQPYDAPRWVRSDGPVRFGELADSPDALEAHGRFPEPVRLNLRLPPDLLTWNQSGVPIDLHYRYTAPLQRDESALTVEVNDRLARVIHLRPDTEAAAVQRLIVPLLPGAVLGESERLMLPALQVGIDNTLRFQFALDSHVQGACRERMPDVARFSVDPDSTIDISKFYHYTAMPNLALFANAGFPFTRYADLAETVVVVPPLASAASLEELYFVLGRLGRLTGTPATGYRLEDGSDPAKLRDADLLILSGAQPNASPGATGQELALQIDQGRRRFNVPQFATRFDGDPLNSTGSRAHAEATVTVAAAGSIGALVGYQSEVTGGRSVVALIGGDPAASATLIDALEDSTRVGAVRGDFTLVRGAVVQSYRGDKGYYLGSLPLGWRLWFHISLHPLLLTIFTLAVALGLAAMIYSWLRRRAARRLDGKND